jgi:hypothetical protein
VAAVTQEEEVAMYRINPLMRNVLITTDEVVFHAPTKHTIDPRMIEQSIIIAEERLIRPALGFEFYTALCAQKNTLVTDANKVALQATIDDSQPAGSQPVILNTGDIVNAYEYLNAENLALWKQYLWKLAAESVVLLSTSEAFIQFASTGVIHAQPPAGPMNAEGVVTPDLRSVKWFMDKKMMDRVDPLRESMHLWLCQQKSGTSKYSLYTKACDCNADGVAYKRKTDWVVGMYDDDDDKKCCK